MRHCADTLRCGQLLVEQWCAEASTTLCVDARRHDLALHTGADDARVAGRWGEANLYSGIMAPIDAAGLRAGTVRVNNSIVAYIRCWAQEALEAQVRSVGDEHYRGGPPSVQHTITGTGRLIKAD